MRINGLKLIEEYEKTPSLRILAKKYRSTPRTIKKYILFAGGTLNFKKGSLENYKPNKGSFRRGLVPWNKNKKMNESFCKRQKEIMNKKVREGWKPPSTNPKVAKKISQGRMGLNNPNWKGGITKENQRKRSILIKDGWSREVLKRDKYQCQLCGTTTINLDAHHIKQVNTHILLANDISNGVALCKPCHYKTYKNEKKFEEYFKNTLEGFKIITITSNRPDLLRQSLIIEKLDTFFGKNHIYIYTGQNYDSTLYNIFLKDLKLRKPDYEFNLKEKLTGYRFFGQCATNIENILNNFNKNQTLINILGDVNGSLASAYVSARMGFKVIHNESGNRSGRNILEEINRKAIDTMSYKLLCYTQRSRENLLKEGYDTNKIIVCGNPLIEVLEKHFDKNELPIIKGKYILVTLHRNESINDFTTLRKISEALKILSLQYKIVFVLHPSLKDKIDKNKDIENLFMFKNIELHNAVNYTTFLNFINNASIFLSDSGGECEEATLLKIPCLVLRNETERTELLEFSQMILCGVETDSIVRNAKIVKELPLSGVPEEYKKPTSSIVVKILSGV